MKNIVVFVLLSIAFFSCRENQVASEQMDRAETLLPVYPDSAYVILEGVELPDKLNERRKYEEAADYFKKAGNIRSYAFALRDISITWVFEDSLSLALKLIRYRNERFGRDSIDCQRTGEYL